MGNFFRSSSTKGLDDEQGFMQGAGRMLVADRGGTLAFPTDLDDILVTASGATQYDAVVGWEEVGFTKTGINIVRNNTEETFTVDQYRSAIKTRPSNWEMSVGTQLAETSLETFALAWELESVTNPTAAGPGTKGLRRLGMGAATSYKERMLAVVFIYPDDIVRAYVWRRCLHAAQESGFTMASSSASSSRRFRRSQGRSSN
jgi:hypothetical protein